MSTINPSTAANLAFSDGSIPLGTKPSVDGYVLTYDSGTGTIRGEAAAGGGVTSVNGETGVVVLDAADVGAIAEPATPTIGESLEYDGAVFNKTAAGATGQIKIGRTSDTSTWSTPVIQQDGVLALSGATASVLVGSQIDLCDGGDVANLISSPPTGARWSAATANITAARASNVITIVRNSTSATESRETTGTLGPALFFENPGTDFDLVIALDNNGAADFKIAFVGMQTGNNVATGVNVWKTSVEYWLSALTTITTKTITQTQKVWVWLQVSGTKIKAYYSTSTNEPTVIGATASTQWFYLGQTPLAVNTTAPTQEDNVGLTLFDTITFGHTVNVYVMRLTRR